jgi:hypothetical protein
VQSIVERDPETIRTELEQQALETRHREAVSEQSAGAIANEKYIAACRERKNSLVVLKGKRMSLRAQVRAAHNAVAATAVGAVDVAFERWAAEQRKQCEAWIESKRPIGLGDAAKGSGPETLTLASLKAELATVEMELSNLTAAVPQRSDFL